VSSALVSGVGGVFLSTLALVKKSLALSPVSALTLVKVGAVAVMAVSTVTACEAAAPMLPALSTTRACTV
jgi:hypothetical protein